MPPFETEKAGRERNNKRRDLRHEAVADRKLHEHIGRGDKLHLMPEHADNDPAKGIYGGNDEAGNRVAAYEFRRTVHGAEKSALLLQLAPSRGRLLFVDDARREIGVDRHLLAGDGVQCKPRANLGNPGCAFGDNEKVHGDDNGEDDNANDKIPAHDEVRKPGDNVAGSGMALGAVGKDQPGGRDIQR